MSSFRHVYNLGMPWFIRFKRIHKNNYTFDYQFTHADDKYLVYDENDDHILTFLPREGKVFTDIPITKINEDAMGGVSAPMATLNNVPGMGSAVPASGGGKGSGDSWGKPLNKKPYTQGKTKKKKPVKKKAIKEENTNPYNDETKIGKLLKGSSTSPFKKKKAKGNQNSIVQKKFEHKIDTFDEFTQKLNEGETNLMKDWKNTYWRVLEPFEVWVLAGHRPGNAYYGAAQLYEPLWKKMEVYEEDQLHALVGGLFLIQNETDHVFKEPRIEKPEWAPFEKKRDYNYFPLEKLEQITDSREINKPHSYR
jgi:hypothetical protein